jgi:hypothetical protein
MRDMIDDATPRWPTSIVEAFAGWFVADTVTCGVMLGWRQGRMVRT